MKNKGRDYSQLLIWAALAVSVTRFAGAFVASDVGKITDVWSLILTILMAISGVGMGFLDVLGMAYLFDGWRRVLPRTGDRPSIRFWILTGFVIGLAFVGVGILVPFTVSRIRADSMHGVMGDYDWLWSVAVNLSPFLLIGGIMTAQSGIVTIRSDAAEAPNRPAHSGGSPAEKTYTCPHCSEKCDSASALANHIRWRHPKIPTNHNGKVHEVETISHN